jgi:hypothetical protein
MKWVGAGEAEYSNCPNLISPTNVLNSNFNKTSPVLSA